MAIPARSSGPFRLTVPPIVGAQSLQEMQRQMNDALQSVERQYNLHIEHLQNALDSLKGYRGTVEVKDTLSMQRNRLTDLPEPIQETAAQAATSLDAVPRKWAVPLVRQPNGTLAWDCRFVPMINDVYATDPTGIPSLQQVRDLIQGAVQTSGIASVEGTFTITATGFTAGLSGTARYIKVGKLVTLAIPTLTGTSNSTAFTLTGLPALIVPLTALQSPALHGFDNSAHIWTFAELAAGSSTITMRSLPTIRDTADDPGAIILWTNTNTKGINASVIAYHLF